MKRLVFILFVIVLSGLNLEGYICWESNGKAVRQETHLNYDGTVSILENGEMITLWSDASGFRQEMKVQKLSAAGEVMWDEPLVLSSAESYYPDAEQLLTTYNGDITAVWYELGDQAKIKMQRFTEDGELLWGEEGRSFALNSAAWECFTMKAVADGAGGIYLFWKKINRLAELWAVHLTAEGEVAAGWSPEGNSLQNTDDFVQDFDVIADGFGGVVYARRYDSTQTYLQRIDSIGNNMWGDGIILDFLSMCGDVQLLPWNPGEYAVVLRIDNEIMANIISFTGEMDFPEMQVVAAAEFGGLTGTWIAKRTADEKVAVVYREYTNSNDYVWLQKTAIGGEPEWGVSGQILDSYDNYDYFKYDITNDEQGGVAACWDVLTDSDFRTNYQHFDSDGGSINGGLPILIDSSSYYCHAIEILRQGDSSVIFRARHDDDENSISVQIYNSEEQAQYAGGGNTVWSVLAGEVSYQYDLQAGNEFAAISWGDTRYDVKNAFIQLIQSDSGELLFASDGIAVSEQNEHREENTEICLDSSEEHICVFYTQENETLDQPKVQVFDLDGNRLMGENGAVLDAENHSYGGMIESIGANDFVLIWSEDNNDFMNPEFFVSVQRVHNNQLQWTQQPIELSQSDQYVEDVLISYPYICWQEEWFLHGELRLARLEDDGSLSAGWDPQGRFVAEEDNCIRNLKMYKYEEDALIFWEHYDISGNVSIKGQRVNASGELLWEEEGRILGEELYDNYEYEFEDGFLYVRGDLDGVNDQLYKYDLAGGMVWEDAIDLAAWQSTDISFFNIWQEQIIVYILTEDEDILALIYDENGEMVENIPEGGLAICTQMHRQNIRNCDMNSDGYGFVLWRDCRGEYKPAYDPSLYIQKIDLRQLPVMEEDIPDGTVLQMSNYPNPFTGSTVLKCEQFRSMENAEIVIYNIKGQKVRSLPAESEEVVWDCRNDQGKPAGSGIYFYLLKGENIKSRTGRMIMVK